MGFSYGTDFFAKGQLLTRQAPKVLNLDPCFATVEAEGAQLIVQLLTPGLKMEEIK
jgi:hypothetical protein